ncbi:hypothetical protein EVAR_98168_1 [Eumeta japonica]|uniref:Uncharacterized protein n=1 Tax=Eumeta variegata TaxID=151549 RepID=A0A4C1YIZ2_EUMVA|nr:hypothetical protein EVAR_98168_1 [Eumeta japonica]
MLDKSGVGSKSNSTALEDYESGHSRNTTRGQFGGAARSWFTSRAIKFSCLHFLAYVTESRALPPSELYDCSRKLPLSAAAGPHPAHLAQM